MDFVRDGLADGRRLRCLTIVDNCTRECLAKRQTGSSASEDLSVLVGTSQTAPDITVESAVEDQGRFFGIGVPIMGHRRALPRSSSRSLTATAGQISCTWAPIADQLQR
jgi:hypothetical protein